MLRDLLMNEIHIFSRFESSTSSRMNGLTTVIKSQIGVLQSTLPEGKARTFVPEGPVNDSVVDFVFSSIRLRFDGMASKSFTWFSTIASGTGMFRSWWTSFKLRLANICVSNSSLRRTIFSGKPTVIKFSAFFIKPSLYSCTWNNTVHISLNLFSWKCSAHNLNVCHKSCSNLNSLCE